MSISDIQRKWDSIECRWSFRLMVMMLISVFCFWVINKIMSGYDQRIDALEPPSVVSNMSVSDAALGPDGWLHLSIYGDKNLECAPVEDSYAGYVRNGGGVWREVPFMFVDDISPNSARPIGANDFGVWAWHPGDQYAYEVMMTMQHVCQSGIVYTTIGPFEVH
jgi:hypothetical protein